MKSHRLPIVKRGKKHHRRNRRHRNSTILSQEQKQDIPTSTETADEPEVFDLEIMIKLCKANWSRWLSQVSVARIQQVTVLADQPSIENIELLQDLEKLGVKLGQVG